MPNPEVRKVRVRLEGADTDAVQVAAMLANLLPTMSQGSYQVGELSPSYPNRRGSGTRRYFDLYLLRTPTQETPGPSTPGTEVMPATTSVELR